MNNYSFNRDLELILENTSEFIEEFRDTRLLLIGGTGFFGKWLLKTFCYANDELDLNVSIIVLTRSRKAFLDNNKEFSKHNCIEYVEADIRSFSAEFKNISYIIHAAAGSDAKLYNEVPLEMYDTIVGGTRNILDFAVKISCRKLLFISSGAVYGPQPANIANIREDFLGGPDTVSLSSVYAEAKRNAELLCKLYSSTFLLDIKIARCFAFVGPYLPLNKHFAIGNFILNVLNKEPILIKGDGTTIRSYLYVTGLVIWLLKILVSGKSCYPYNVGSEVPISTIELARKVFEVLNSENDIIILGKSDSKTQLNQYVPSTKRAQNELGLKQMVSLEESIEKTYRFCENNKLYYLN